MLAIIVQGLDGIVRHDIIFVEDYGVETDSSGELELIINIPLILGISTDLIETYLCRRILVPVISPVKSELYRLLFTKEIAQACETVGTRSITHISVESHLGLVAYAGSDLMGTFVPGDVILDVKDRVHYLITVSKELCSEVHIRLFLVPFPEVSRKNLNEREESSVITTLVNNIGIGNEQLVRNVVGNAAVKVSRYCVKVVHLIVQGVRENQTIF